MALSLLTHEELIPRVVISALRQEPTSLRQPSSKRPRYLHHQVARGIALLNQGIQLHRTKCGRTLQGTSYKRMKNVEVLSTRILATSYYLGTPNSRETAEQYSNMIQRVRTHDDQLHRPVPPMNSIVSCCYTILARQTGRLSQQLYKYMYNCAHYQFSHQRPILRPSLSS